MKRGSWVYTALIVLALITAGCSSGADFNSIVEDNPDKVVTINKLSGDNADLFLQSLEGFCEEINEDKVYRVQVIGDNETLTKVLSTKGKTLCEVDTSDPQYANKAVAVMVNNATITLAQVQNAVRNLPEQQRAQNAGPVINDMINQELLLQEANYQGITVSDQRVNQALQQALNQSQANLNQLGEEDLNILRQNIRERLKVQKLTSQVLQEADVSVSEQEMRDYYEDNKANLTLPKTWSIRHIQINIGDRTEQQTLQKARTVYNLLNQSSFCDLVQQFSDDTESLNQCGRYTFASGDMLPSIEAEVKDMNTTETRIVKSRQAYHILQLEGVNQPRQASYEEVKPRIKNFLQSQKRQQALQQYLQKLREDADIVSYLG